MRILIVFIISFVFVSCRLKKTYTSCEEYCSSKGHSLASTIVPGGIRCHEELVQAMIEGKKLGLCDERSLSTGDEARHPDPEACLALINQAQEKCKASPYNSAMMNQAASGSVFFEGGRPVIINGEFCKCSTVSLFYKRKCLF